jgi:type IV pilus assembly protein PilO
MARSESVLNKLPPLAKVGIGALFVVLIGVAYFVVFYGDLASSIAAEKSQEHQLRQDLSTARQNEFSYQKDVAELSDRQQRQRELI